MLCGFLLPAFSLLQLLIKQGLTIDIRYLDWLSNSSSVSVLTTLISVAFAVFFAYSARMNSRLSWVNRLLGFGYALPGAVLAIGILSLLEIFQLAWWMSSQRIGAGLRLFSPVSFLQLAKRRGRSYTYHPIYEWLSGIAWAL